MCPVTGIAVTNVIKFKNAQNKKTAKIIHSQMQWTEKVYGHFGTKTLRHQDTSAPVPKCRDTSAPITEVVMLVNGVST